MKITVIFSLILTVWGCHSNTPSDTPQETAVTDTFAPDGTVTDTSEVIPPAPVETSFKEIKTFKGLYISGNEISTFRDCANTAKVYWVEDESKKLGASYKKAKGFLSYPYESVYAEVKGYFKGKSNVGYAEEYENVLVVTDVITTKQKSFSTDCYNYEFIGLGNEPFWSLDIIPSEKIIALKDVGSEKTYTFPYKAGTTSGNVIRYETSNGKNEKIKATITKETCSDGMSDRKYNYLIQVIIKGKTLTGCAIKKGDKMVLNQ